MTKRLNKKQRAILNALRELPNDWVNKEDLLRKTGYKSTDILHDLNVLGAEGYVRLLTGVGHDFPDSISITTRGKEKLGENFISRLCDYVYDNPWVIITAVLAIAAPYLASLAGATAGADTAFELTKPYLIPNEPAFNVYLKNGPSFCACDFSAVIDNNWNASICFQNYGRLDSGRFTYQWITNKWNLDNGGYLPNVLSGETKCVTIPVVSIAILQNDTILPFGLTIPKAPFGWTNLTLKIDCEACEKELNKTFSFCIWEDAPWKCEKGILAINTSLPGNFSKIPGSSELGILTYQ